MINVPEYGLSPCLLIMSMHSATIGYSVIWVVITSNWLVVLFRFYIILLVFCLPVLSPPERWVLKSLGIIVLSISVVSFCFMYFKVQQSLIHVLELLHVLYKLAHLLSLNIILCLWYYFMSNLADAISTTFLWLMLS